MNVKFWQHFTIWYWTLEQEKWDFSVNAHSKVCLNVKERFGRSWRHIWSLSVSNVIWTHNHLVRKRTLNHLAKLAKWLSCVVRAYLYGAFDCMFYIV